MDRWRSAAFDDFGSRFKRSGSFNNDGMGMGPDSKRSRFGEPSFGMEPQPCEPIICIRNIPYGITGDYVMGFLNHMMHYTGIAQAPGDPVLAFKMNMDLGVGLFKFRAIVEARQALNTLDGVPLKGNNLEMRPYIEDNGGSPPYPEYQDGYFRQQEMRNQVPQFYGNDRRRKFGGRMERPPRRERGSQQSGLSRGGDTQENQMDPSRTLYIGNILRKASEIEVRKFLNEQMHSKELVRREGDPISLGSDLPNFYSFQVRSADEATKALGLHGAEFKTRKLVLRRPREYYTLQGKSDSVAGSHYDVTHRIYVGNIPPNTTEDELRVFLDQQMHEKELAKSEGDCILAGPMSKRQNFYFIEFRSSEEATEALSLDGVEFKGQILKIKRPANYKPPGGKPSRSSDEKDGPDASWLLASWNIGDVSSSEKQSEIDHALFRMSIDVAAIQKTNLAGGTLSTAHYEWYLSAGEEANSNGVAFLVLKKHLPNVSEWNPCGERMASLHFKTSQQNITMITVLVQSSDDPEAASLMDQIEETVSNLPAEDHILLLGDFSAEIGKEDLSEEDGQWIGASLLHANSNDNGKRLKAMLHNCGLYLDTTRGPSTVVTLVTGKESSQVDHVLSNCKNLIKWIRSTTLGDHGTDHKVVRAAMRMTRCNEHPVEARDDEPMKADDESGQGEEEKVDTKDGENLDKGTSENTDEPKDS